MKKLTPSVEKFNAEVIGLDVHRVPFKHLLKGSEDGQRGLTDQDAIAVQKALCLPRILPAA